MSHDVLERATRALRDEGLPPQEDLAETRARLLASSRTSAAQRGRALRWVLPLAAAFAAGTAFAATNGQLERAVRAVQTWLREPAQEVVTKTKRPPKHEPAPALPATTSQESAPIGVEPSASRAAVPEGTPSSVVHESVREQSDLATAQRSTRTHSAGRRAEGHGQAEPSGREVPSKGEPSVAEKPEQLEPTDVAGAADATPPVVERAPNPDLSAYREAHRAHFVARSFKDALELWDGYLAKFPHGIFALEARYNRAICLFRLGRKEEAERALLPFAEGKEPGAYRRDEARALLDALQSKP